MKKIYKKPEINTVEYLVEVSIANWLSFNSDIYNENDESLFWYDILK